MARLWQVMGNTFMHKWNSYAGEIDGACFVDWSKGLADLTEEELKTGVNKLPTLPPNPSGESWPPSLNEFRLLCRPKSQPTMYTDSRALPKPDYVDDRADDNGRWGEWTASGTRIK